VKECFFTACKNAFFWLLAPGGVASFADMVWQQRYNGSRDHVSW